MRSLDSSSSDFVRTSCAINDVEFPIDLVGLDAIFASASKATGISVTWREVIICEDDLGATEFFKYGLCYPIALFDFEGCIARIE